MLALMFFTGASLAHAQQPRTLERRVTEIPAARLLSSPPAALVDARRQEAAAYLVRYTRPAWFVWVFLQIAALVYVWRSGWAARARDALRRSFRPLWIVRFCFGGFVVMVAEVAALPAQFYDYRIYRIMGLSTQHAGSWWSDILLTTALEMVVVGVAVVVILWLVDRTHLWWVYTVALIAVSSFALSFVYPILVEPLFNHFTALPAKSSLTPQVRTLAARAGAVNLPILISDLSRRTRAGNAYVIGIGPSKRIVIGDTLLNTATEPEVVFVVAHELGHNAHADTFKGAIFGALVFIFGAALAVLIADRIAFRRDDDPLSRLPLVAALLFVMSIVFMPLINGYSRTIEADADSYALQLTRDRVAGTRAFVRFADGDLALLCPGRLARVFWYTHPPLGTRISSLNGQPNPCP